VTIEVHVKTVVLPGGKIEISIPELVAGQEATVVITVENEKPLEQRHVIDILNSLPKHRMFKTIEEVDAYIREEREAWDH
jgi:hypothetical protein